jgi:hypothetical protein
MMPLLTTASTVMCPHAGMALLVSGNTEALIDGAPALLETDVHPVVGCTFFSGPNPMPCLLIRWTCGAVQTRLHGVGFLLSVERRCLLQRAAGTAGCRDRGADADAGTGDLG